jgi:hypothetical protein
MKPVMKNDSAVSEIIGAILLFAIASVLLTSFILWYVPSTGTNNDITYQSQTQQSFSSLDSKLLSPSLTPGSSISQSMPLGISGVPPFSPSQSTNLYYNKNFNASMSYKANVTYENAVPIKNLTMAACANSTPSNIRNNVYVSSQFTYSVIFVETGLPGGYYWTVSLGGTQKSAGTTSPSIASYVTFSLPRGTYSYKISSNNGVYNPNPSSGTIKVNVSGSNIGTTFSGGKINGIIAGAEGGNGEINNVNQSNFIGVVTQSGLYNIQYLNYWLNNTTNSNGMYNLSSQQFFVYSANTPVDYYQFLIQPNMVYYEQASQGVAYIYTSIGSTPWGGNVSGTCAVTKIPGQNISNYYTETVNVTLATGVSLSTGTYYLNIWEVLDQSVNNQGIYNDNLKSPSCYLMFSSSLYIKNNGELGAPESDWGYGYGPNEFIGTITNPSLDVSVGNAYYYTATIKAACKAGATHFIVQKENLVESSTPYYFLIGYTPTSQSSSTPYKINITEKNLPVGTKWNITFGGKLYCNVVGSSGTNNFTVTRTSGIYSYNVSKAGLYLSDPTNGFFSINTSSGAVNDLNISYFEPVGSLPYSWDSSDYALQQFSVSKAQTINFVSLYFYNYTIGPASFNGNKLNYTVNIEILDASTLQPVKGNYSTVFSHKIYQTGWTQIFFNGTKGFNIQKGVYDIRVSDVGGSNNAIGLGFTTTGGYSNYLQRVCTNFMSGSINDIKNVTVTPYYGGSPIKISNTSLVFQTGFYNVTTSFVVNNITIQNNFKIIGSVEATGNTQFSIQETYALQDGIIITAGKGVTYVTVNPLPISLSSTSNGTLALSSIGYNMSMAKSVATSISGYGSTILSATMENQTANSYTVNNNFVIGSVFAKVLNITLLNYNYTINSAFSKYWANTFFVELVGSSQNENYTNFNVFKQFNFLLTGNMEKISIARPVDLSTINLKTVSIEINSM